LICKAARAFGAGRLFFIIDARGRATKFVLEK
jgi:hypothetical protein